MPIGILVNCAAVLLGGLIGGAAGNRIPSRLKEALPIIFGFCSIMIGISLTVKMENLPAVVLALIAGTIVGELLRLEDWVSAGAEKLKNALQKQRPSPQNSDAVAGFISMLVLFCASGTGIFGALNEGMTGDHTILLAKSILDFFTAIIFATSVGYLISVICIPQLMIFLLLFFSASFIIPLTTTMMIGDFKACGGIITLAVGFRILEIRSIRIVNVLPALVLVMPLSWLWTTFLQ